MGRIRFNTILTLTAILIFVLSGCGAAAKPEASAQTSSQPNYNEVKTMVLDILHSQQGLTTLKDIAKDPEFKKSLAINEQDMQTILEKTMMKNQNQAFLQQQMKDPKFAAAIVKASKTESTQILKQLMGDPEYQKSMLSLMKTPEYQKMLMDLTKTPEYRQQTMNIMTQALQNPEFKLLFMETVKEAIKQGATAQPQQQKSGSQSKDKQSQQSQSSDEGS
ncbi:spore gernimation protein [Fodinisporobacter ferrooxydans]|uniref:Spore gernimation protein n=1 Tax=Fodinisporobacter ferrooxydans TaxID=2901836 RepID=A0ABY4CNE6_9BACL|nr:spore gernimation protein [Alicyclobacillaceae bacterium MYW30-H2]